MQNPTSYWKDYCFHLQGCARSRSSNWIHFLARSRSVNWIHLPLSLDKFSALPICMSVLSYHPKMNKLNDTSLPDYFYIFYHCLSLIDKTTRLSIGCKSNPQQCFLPMIKKASPSSGSASTEPSVVIQSACCFFIELLFLANERLYLMNNCCRCMCVCACLSVSGCVRVCAWVCVGGCVCKESRQYRFSSN